MKRSRHRIISQILDICKTGAIKTRIVHQANLNFSNVNPYMDLLAKNDLIKVEKGKTVSYTTTEKGINLLNNIREMDRQLTEL